MKLTKIFCDICDKEFPPQEYCFLTGQIIKVNTELKPEVLGIEGHYCGEDTHKIIEFIASLKNENNNPPRVDTEPVPEGSNNGAE